MLHSFSVRNFGGSVNGKEAIPIEVLSAIILWRPSNNDTRTGRLGSRSEAALVVMSSVGFFDETL